MTTPTNPRKRPESSKDGSGRSFNPFVNEADMFKVVVWAGLIAVALIVLVVLVRTIV